jgi:hypothetical protein
MPKGFTRLSETKIFWLNLKNRDIKSVLEQNNKTFWQGYFFIEGKAPISRPRLFFSFSFSKTFWPVTDRSGTGRSFLAGTDTEKKKTLSIVKTRLLSIPNFFPTIGIEKNRPLPIFVSFLSTPSTRPDIRKPFFGGRKKTFAVLFDISRHKAKKLS